MLGDRSENSHIMSSVYSNPDIVVLISRLGLFTNCSMTLDVNNEMN